MIEVLFSASVDCDMRISSAATRDEALWALAAAFERQGAAGHATWYLNENDFALTYLHGRFVGEVAGRGDTIGVHDHIDFLGDRLEYDSIHAFCSTSLARVSRWLEGIGRTPPVAHRFGCCCQRPAAYRVLLDLGYTSSSDVCPGTRHRNHTGRPSFDNRDVPIGVRPYRHGPDTITDHQTDAGEMFQIPMMKATLTADFWPRLDRSILDAWVRGAETLGQDAVVLCFGFHPYEIVERDNLLIDPAGVGRLEEILTMAREQYGARFVNVEECRERFAGI